MLNFPGIGPQVGACVLGRVGDDRSRFTTAGGLKAYAGSAPITRASGKRRYVGRRFVKNNRLNHVGHLWAFASLSGSTSADATTGAAEREETGRLCGTCSTGCLASFSTVYRPALPSTWRWPFLSGKCLCPPRHVGHMIVYASGGDQ